MKILKKTIYQIRDFLIAALKPDTFATFVNYFTKIFLNPIIVFFVPLFIDDNTQGYWYTFGSIGALTTFADLGFTSIMTQFAAHEYTYLSIDWLKGFTGDSDNIERISSLFKYFLNWLYKVLIIALIVILSVGIIIFSNKTDSVRWIIPWVLYVIATVINFSTQAELSFFEGCDQFATTQRIRTFASVLHCVSTILLLWSGAGLYALSIPLFLKALVVIILLNYKYRNSIRMMLCYKLTQEINWSKNIMPLILRYAISWISGYFAFNIYNPLVFALKGANAAGKVGYSLSIISAIYSVANVWSLVSIPKYNMAVELKKWDYLDLLVKKNIIYSCVTYTCGIVALYSMKFIPMIDKLIWTRIMPSLTVMMLASAYLFSAVCYALATYLRAHKKEPFLFVSVLDGILSALLTFIILWIFDLDNIFMGVLISKIIITPISLIVFFRCRNKWHTIKGIEYA